MNMLKLGGILALVSVLLLFGCTQPAAQNTIENDAMDDGTVDDDAMMDDSKNDDDAMMNDDPPDGTMMKDDSTYQPFNQAAFESARANEKVVFLEFYANWCPFCATQKPINESAFASTDMPDGVVGFQVNYNDSETDESERNMARTYGVSYQHTRVILAPDGTVVHRSTGDISQAALIEAIRQAGA